MIGMLGTLTWVEYDDHATGLVDDTTATATVLTVGEADQFSETGGWLRVGDRPDILVYTAADHTAETITLAAPLGVPAAAGDQVLDCDEDGTTRVTVTATLDIGDDTGEGLPVDAQEWKDRLRPGDTDAGLDIEYETQEDGYRISNIPDSDVKLDGAAIDPGTLPDPGTPTAPPPASPALTVEGTVDTLIVKTSSPVEASTVLTYHVSTVDGFAPDATTALDPGQTRADVFAFSTLPDGSPLAPDTDYFVRVVASNVAGAAAAGPQATGRLNPDVASRLFLALLVAGWIAAGGISVGLIEITPDGGILVPQPNGGVIQLPADGSQALLDAYVIARGLTVTDDASFMALLQIYGTARMANGVTNPSAVGGLASTWTSLPSGLGPGPYEVEYQGVVPSVSGTQLAAAFPFWGGGGIALYSNPAPGESAVWYGNVSTPDWMPHGITRIGTRYYVLGQSLSDSSWSIRRWDQPIGTTAASAWVEATPIALPGFAPAGRPTIGTNGSDILVAYSYRNGNGVTVDRRGTGGGLLESVGCTPSLGKVLDLSAVAGGSFDTGAARYFIAPAKPGADAGGKILAFTSTGARAAAHDFTVAGATQVRGLWWDGTRFRHLDGTGKVWSYYAGNPASSTLYARYSWYDGDAAGTGTHETAASPAKAWTWPARTYPVIDGRPAPHAQVTDPTKTDKANLVRLYAGPAADQCRLQATLPVGVSASIVDQVATGTALAPTSSTFGGAATAPGIFESGAVNAAGVPHTRLDGAGAARIVKLLQGGTVTIPITATGAVASVDVTFDTPFNAAPGITLGIRATQPDDWAVSHSNPTTNGVTIHAVRRTGSVTSLQVVWSATPAT